MSDSTFKFKDDYEAAKLHINAGANDLLIYALSYYLDVNPDVLKESITDGGGDQSADLIYIDVDNDRAIVAQGTEEAKWFKDQASTSKAASLGQAVNWLLVAPLDAVPERIRTKAVELRALIDSGDIDSIELVFCHNALETRTVRREIEVVADSAALVKPAVKFKAVELGANGTEELFLAATSLIAVQAEIVISVIGTTVLSEGDRWNALIASVPGSEIYKLYEEYKDGLFSANVRDYLGTRKSTKNINLLMKETALTRGADFFVLNNGITLLTDKMSLSDDGQSLTLKGVSVINGAQTTGVLHEAGEEACRNIVLQCRFLESRDENLLEDAVRFNNTQNAVKASDRKSNDEVQKRLTREFGLVGLNYVARRSRVLAAAPGYKIEADPTAQALCSFRGDLTVATRNRLTIWDDRTQYERVFPLDLPWNNVWLVHLITRSLDALVNDIRAKAREKDATASQKGQALFFSFSPSKQAMIFLVGKLREQIMGKGIADPFMWSAKNSTVADKRAELEQALMWPMGRIVSRVANLRKDEAAMYALVRTQSQMDDLVPDLTTFFEDLFSESSQIATIRSLTYIQTP